MAKKDSKAQIGGVLTLLGSLIYLYVYYVWYSAGGALGGWLAATSFLAPFVIAVALFSAVTLFFMGLGKAAGMSSGDQKMSMNILWKFTMVGAITFVIITGGGAWYYWIVLALLLTYVGAMFSSEM